MKYKLYNKLLLTIIITVVNEVSTPAQEIKDRQIIAQKIESAITLDGILNEPAWRNSSPIATFTQREPNNGQPVSEKTELLILFDYDNLYIGVKCWDSQVNFIVANEMRRDNSLFNNDAIEVILDTYNDHQNAFSFITNPLSAQQDGIITAGQLETDQNWDWNGIWECAASINDSGWMAEVKIPFKTLRFPKRDINTWGFNFERIIPRKREEAFWAPIPRELGFSGKYRLDCYGQLIIKGEISQPEKLLIKPFILGGVVRDFEENELYTKQLDIGLDTKYLVSSNVTCDITLNTDFAQVEADQEQYNLTRFELFFPEKRDFFLEGASIFRFGERAWNPVAPPAILFFSRRIGLSQDNEVIPIYGGIKLTGKIDNLGIGMLNMFTNRKDYINDDGEHVMIPRTSYTVLRVKNDMPNNSFFGAMIQRKQSLEDKAYNGVFGIDGNFFLNSQTQIGTFVAKTSSPQLQKKDFAFWSDIFHQSDLLTFRIGQNIIQDNFNPEMGFVSRTGCRTTSLDFSVSPRPDFLGIRQIFLFDDFYYFAKSSGDLESRWNFTGSWTQFQNGSSLLFMFSQNYERLFEEFEIYDGITIPTGVYRFNNFISEYQSDLSEPLSGKLNTTIGQFYDGKLLGIGVGSNLKLGSKLTFNVEYNYNKVNLPVGGFITNLLSLRILYTVSPLIFFKTFIQWNSERNAVLGNFLFNFIHSPGSDLYIVYNEEINTQNKILSSKNRNIILKFTYLFNI